MSIFYSIDKKMFSLWREIIHVYNERKIIGIYNVLL